MLAPASSEAVLVGCDFTHADVSADFFKSVLIVRHLGATAEGTYFWQADITDSTFDKANLARSNFKGANLTRVAFVNADLPLCVFDGATLVDADFRG
ncbi:MAG: pentapeptide repeat-containing protein [Polyangiaceae bacterium]